MDPMARKVLPLSVKLVWRLVRNGSNLALSVPRLPPQVVGDAQVEARQELAQKGVGDRLGGPPGAAGFLGLLEIVRELTGVHAQEPDLADGERRGVARAGLVFPSRVLLRPMLRVCCASLWRSSGCPGVAMARANSSEMVAAGA